MTGRIVMLLLAATVSVAAGQATEEQVKEVEQWRAKHEADYTREYVPLAGLYFLKQGVNTAGSAPGSTVLLPSRLPKSIGRFVYKDGQVTFEPDGGAAVRMNGQSVTKAVALESDEKSTPPELMIDDVAVWVHASGDRRAIRMRDPKGETARTFAGYSWFPIDERYRVTGKFIKDAASREVKIPNLMGDMDTYTTEGVVEFTMDGKTVRLRPFTTRPNRFYFVFRDGTSGRETYDAARFLYSDLRPDGTTVLDFNQAYNPPCAFNPYTTCPVPLPENRLTTVRILAGEKAYSRPSK